MQTLINAHTGEPLFVGCHVMTTRGDVFILDGVAPPRYLEPVGHCFLLDAAGQSFDVTPDVINAVWKDTNHE